MTAERPKVDRQVFESSLPRLTALLAVGQGARSVKFNEDSLNGSITRLEKAVVAAHDAGAGLDELVLASAMPETVVREWIG